MMEFTRDKCRTQIVEGERYGLLRDPQIIREILRFEPGKDDVVLITYPTSGTHWMMQIMQLIVYRGSSSTTHVEFRKRSPILEDHGERISEVTTNSHPRILTTHFRPGLLKINQSSKYVYVARNPWDLCASLYDRSRQTPLYPLRATFQEFVPMFCQGYLPYGSYFEHVSAACKLRNEPNVFFVTYEEITENTAGVIVRLADFLGENHGKAVREDSELLNDIVRKCSPDFMKEMMTVPMSDMAKVLLKNKKLLPLTNVATPKDDAEFVKFVRHARMNRWREVFTKEQLRETLLHIEEIGNEGRVLGTHVEFCKRSPFLEDYGGRISEVTTNSHPRILTTHFRPGLLKINQSSKYVYVARNPWDLCASLYDQSRQTPLYPLRATFQEFVPMFCQGCLPYGSYFEHVSAACKLRNEPNVFFVTYEEITEDTAGVIVRLADFLGENHGKAVREDSELLNDIVRKCSTPIS
ncbi:hypothetical protein MTO96_004637 [Rhipicephalus appendiculatus]